MTTILILLVIFQVKHFLCDYPLQTAYMLRKFSDDWKEWLPALTAHAAVHAGFTGFILLVFKPVLMPLLLVDFVVHFIVDLAKASKHLGSRWKPDNKFFWWALGLDQMIHHLTDYFIIWMIISF